MRNAIFASIGVAFVLALAPPPAYAQSNPPPGAAAAAAISQLQQLQAQGDLQVELAQLKHMATRLVRGWTHLERQRGGSIGLRGPGETQLHRARCRGRHRDHGLPAALGRGLVTTGDDQHR